MGGSRSEGSSPGQLVQVGKDSLGDAFYEVVVQTEGVDADQQGDGVPGNVHQVVVAQVQVFQGLQEVLEGSLRYAVQLVVGQDEVPQVDQALEVRVVQGGQAVGVQVEGVEILEVGEGVRKDLTDGVPAQGQVDLPETRDRPPSQVGFRPAAEIQRSHFKFTSQNEQLIQRSRE